MCVHCIVFYSSATEALINNNNSACFHHNARLTSWRTLMTYFVLSGEEFLNRFLSSDPVHDRLRDGPSHGYNTPCLKISSQSEQ